MSSQRSERYSVSTRQFGARVSTRQDATAESLDKAMTDTLVATFQVRSKRSISLLKRSCWRSGEIGS